MPTRRTGVLTALLLTAALFLAMPELWRDVMNTDPNRMHQSLRPPTARTLTVWLLAGDVGDQKLIRETCSAFEKAQRGARIFLRTVTADELTAESAVKPDVLLFSTGAVTAPQDALLPIEIDIEDASGQYAGVRYAIPLWFSANVLAYPADWGGDPWDMLLQPNAIELPSGVALQQLLMTCPAQHRQAFADAALGRLSPAPTPSLPADGVPRARGQTATPAPAIAKRARVCAPGEVGEDETALALAPAVSHRVRYVSICRDGPDAQAFVQFLMRADAPAQQFTRVLDASTVLPNAFAHTAEELEGLCLDGFTRLEDPALTLLKLR